MEKIVKKIILVCCISLLLLSCLFTGAKLPEYNGVYYIAGRNDYVELEMFKGSPEPEQYSSLVVANDEPEFLFYEPNINLDLLQLYNLTGENEYSYSYIIEDDIQILISINNKMEDGIYCFSQGDYSAIPGQTKTWCFSVGDNFEVYGDAPEENVDISNNETTPTSNMVWWVEHESDGPYQLSIDKNLAGLIKTGGMYVFTEDSNQDRDDLMIIIPKKYTLDNNAVYIRDENDIVAAFDINDGNELWSSGIEGDVIGEGLETVFVYSDNHRIYGLDKNSGQESWKIIIDLLVPEPDDLTIFPIVITHNGEYIIPLVHKIPQDGPDLFFNEFMSISETSGDTKLSNYKLDLPEIGTPILFLNETLILKSDSFVFGINLESGMLQWYWGGDRRVRDSAIQGFDRDESFLFMSYYDNDFNEYQFNAIDISTGNYRVWDEPLSLAKYKNDFTVYINEKYVYIVLENLVLNAYDRQNGSLLNSIMQDYEFTLFPSKNGVILYFPDLEISKAINPITGEVYWDDDETKFDGWFYSLNDIVYLKYKDSEGIDKIKAVEVLMGNILWEVEANILDSNNYIEYFASYDNSIIYDNNLIFTSVHRSKYVVLLESINLLSGGKSFVELRAFLLIEEPNIIEIIDNNTWMLFSENHMFRVKH